MKMLDEKGRILGKVNLIDGVIVLIILFIVMGGGLKVYQRLLLDPAREDGLIDVIVKVENEAMKADLAAYLRPGSQARMPRSVEDGKIVSVDVAEPDIYHFAKGQLLIPVDNKYKKVTVEFTAVGEIYSNSLYLYGERVFLGQDITLVSGMVRFNGTITEIRPLEGSQ